MPEKKLLKREKDDKCLRRNTRVTRDIRSGELSMTLDTDLGPAIADTVSPLFRLTSE